MSEQTDLPAMVGFVGKHVAQHLRTNGPGLGPAVSQKCLHAAVAIVERFSEHLRAAVGALGQCRACLLRRATGPVELCWDFQVRGGEPDPLGAHIVHVGEDRSDGAHIAGRLRIPCGRIKVFKDDLVHPLVGGKNLNCCAVELRASLWFTRLHNSLFLALWDETSFGE